MSDLTHERLSAASMLTPKIIAREFLYLIDCTDAPIQAAFMHSIALDETRLFVRINGLWLPFPHVTKADLTLSLDEFSHRFIQPMALAYRAANAAPTKVIGASDWGPIDE